MKALFKNKGFTMSELLVYIAVLTIIVAAVTSFFLWISRSINRTRALKETLDNSRIAIDILSHEIKDSNGIYSPNSVFDSDVGQLSLETTNYLPSGEVTSYIDFFICDTRLCIKKEGEAPIALTSESVEVIKMRFSQVSTTSTAPSVQINLQIDYKSASSRPADQFSLNTTTTVSLRAI